MSKRTAIYLSGMFSVLCTILLPSVLVAQNRETLETKVTAAGDMVSLLWDAKHPWDAELLAHGASLMAEYATQAHGVVSERLSTARPVGAQSRLLQFTLPERLTTEPVSAVCLSIQLADQRLLPLRKPVGRSRDTARFRDEAWEHVALSQTRTTRQNEKMHAMQETLRSRESAYEAQRRLTQEKGWTSVAACEQIKVPSFALKQKPDDVLPTSEHENAARRVCVSRVKWNEEWKEKQLKEQSNVEGQIKVMQTSAALVQSPEILEKILPLLEKARPHDPSLQARRQQLQAFAGDWKRWSPSADTYTHPPVGSFHDELDVQDLVQVSAFRVIASLLKISHDRDPVFEDFAGFVGGSLEAYSRCVVDGQTQLVTKLTSWNEMQQQAPIQDAKAQQQMQQSCRKQVQDVERLAQEVSSLKAQVESEQKNQHSFTGRSYYTGGVQVLNDVSCSMDALVAGKTVP